MNEEFPKKYAKILETMPEFKSAADASSKEELNTIIVTSEGNIYTIDKAKEADEKLNAAKACVKEFSEPYQDASKVQMTKIKYALFLLESQGVDLDKRPDADEK